jgi:ubiquinone/menaquinone biosynthesis C-methylase UbiE
MAAMNPSRGLGRADTLRMEQRIRRRSSPLQSLSMRAFGRPQGVLGKLGGVIMARTNRAIAARVVELLNIQPSDRVLEVGFGPGVGIQLLAEKITSGEVVGIDCSEEMVEQATARNAAAVGCGRVELQRGSVERLPFANETFDKALAINSMQIWPDPLAALRQMQLMLKPGTIALAFTPYSGQSKEGLTELVTAAGFTDAHMLTLGREFYVFAVRPDGVAC